MNIIVAIKLVPDLVEELKINEEGNFLDLESLRLRVNEFDDHALEQAILLKERGAGRVIVIALDGEGVEDALFTAAAKGADQIIKLTGNTMPLVSNHTLARWLAPVIKSLQPSLVLTGVQAHNDLDGPLGPLLAEYLDLPYVGYVAKATMKDGEVEIRKEYPDGLAAEMEIDLPAVLGIQAAEQPPRYIAFSRIRQAMKTVQLEERQIPDPYIEEPIAIARLFQPEIGERAEIISGDVDEIAARLVDIFTDLDLL
jgi:electron transfer flavoprotein beta subunit